MALSQKRDIRIFTLVLILIAVTVCTFRESLAGAWRLELDSNQKEIINRCVTLKEKITAILQMLSVPLDNRSEGVFPAGGVVDQVCEINDVIHINLTVPFSDYQAALSPVEVEQVFDLLATVIDPERNSGGLAIRCRRNTREVYRPLESFVPMAEPGIYEEPADMPPAYTQAPQTAETLRSMQVESIAEPGHQPSGALSGVVIFTSAGHGWTSGSTSWVLQRPLLHNLIEDYGNLDQLNYFVQYCFNAGATVAPFRPVGYQENEIVLDQDDPEVTYTGSWLNSTGSPYYENGRTVSGISYCYVSSNSTETAAARYTPNIQSTDFYPVYTWLLNSSNRTLQKYRIVHSGGTNEVEVDHRMVGKGWVWLGNYYFEAGTGGYVEISNESSVSGNVIADAVRFGNGIGDLVGAGPGTISGYSREEECSRYWAESETNFNANGLPSSIYDCCSSDQSDNVGTAARWAREMNDSSVGNRWDRVYFEFHTNASSGAARGTVALITGNATTNQALYADIMGEEVEEDMQLLDDVVPFEHVWASRNNTYTGSYGAISTTNNSNEFDATIIEVAFHDNSQDAELLLDGKVRDAVARSCMHGIIKFLNNISGGAVPLVFPPDRPRRVQVFHNGSGGVIISWQPPLSGEAYGNPATGYRIYRSTNGYGFDGGQDVGNVLTTTLTDIPANTTEYICVAAYNAGGESMPSETLAARRPESGSSLALIVNGFDRIDRHLNIVQVLPQGSMQRPIARSVNSFDYIIQHAEALDASFVTFDSCANEAVIDSAIQLGDYDGVVYILGEESSMYHTFDSTEQTLVTSYLDNGGNLFVTGSEIAWELDNLNMGRSFFENYLGGDYIGDDAETYQAQGTGGILSGIPVFDFNPANGAPYNADFPDRINPQAGATSILTYVNGTGDSAGIQYDSGTHKVVMFGFPFETITLPSTRNEIANQIMNWLLPEIHCVPILFADFEEYANGASVMFRPPRYSVETLEDLATSPNVAEVVTVPEFGGTKVSNVEWAWIDTDPQRWLRLTTNNMADLGNPTLDLTRPIQFRFRLASGTLRMCLGVRETGINVPIGQDGGENGTIEWIGATSVTNGAPQGVLITDQSGQWQTITFDPTQDAILGYTGDGVLSAANDKGVLEHIALTITDSTGPFNIQFDNFEQLCVVEPPIITEHPQSQQACPGSTVTFTVDSTTGSGTLSYQWQFNGSDLPDGGDISGATTDTLQIMNVDANDEGDYRCVVTNEAGNAISDPATLTLLSDTVITEHPTSQEKKEGEVVTFTVSATGGGTLSYQWQKDDQNLSDGGRISGTATSTLQIVDILQSDEGQYRCVATGNCGSATSNAGLLTVIMIAPPDFDKDLDVDQEDFGHLQECFTGASVPVTDPDCFDARLDADSDVDQDDLTIFMQCMSGPNNLANPACAE
jgi:hypothetical protein